MNLEEWRKAQAGTEADLPSGLEVVLKKVSVIDLAKAGKIPETLRPNVDAMIARKAEKPMTLGDLEQFAEVVDLVVTAALVAPEELTVTELPWSDRMAIYQWASAETAALNSFRTKQDGALEVARARK